MSEQLDQPGIEVTRIPAVDARLLAAQEEWERQNGNPPFWRINLGAVAGMLSTAKAMIALPLSGAPAAFILEDDAVLADDTPAVLESTDRWPAGAHIVRLEDSFNTSPRWYRAAPSWRSSGKTPSGRNLHPLERWAPGAAACLIDWSGVRIALRAFANPNSTTDHSLFCLRTSRAARRFRTVRVIPAMAHQRTNDVNESDRARWRRKKDAELASRRSSIRLSRNIRALPYKARLPALRTMGKVRKRRIDHSATPPIPRSNVEEAARST